MTIVFELWIECKDEESTKCMANHFSGLQHTLLNNRTIKWGAEITDRPGTLGVVVASGDLSRWGVRTIKDVLETTEAGLRLYHHLKAGPEFRFARVAVEAESLTMADLPEYVETWAAGEKSLNIQCAIDDALYTQLGSPKFFYPLREGYWWNRYSGESYQPLYSNDQYELNELCRKLFPEYFQY